MLSNRTHSLARTVDGGHTAAMGHRASRIESQTWSGTPRWRRAGAGWLLVHVLFGLGVLGLGQIVLAGLALLELRPAGVEPSFTDRLVSWGTLGAAIVLTFVGWLLFVYLRRSGGARWGLLLGLLVLAAALNLGGQWVATRVVTG